MGIAFLCGGSGGVSLNFSIVGGITAPSNPAENTIWVNTGADITGWIFSATEPADPTTGLVWISVGNTSPVEFNALRQNAVIICPLYAQQYIGGIWEDKAAMSYQGASWVDWIYYLVHDGVAMQEFGVINKTWSAETASDTGNDTVVTQGQGYLSIKGTRSGYGAAYVEIDATGKKSVTVEGEFNTDSISVLAAWSSVGNYITSNMVAAEHLEKTGATLDISNLTGKHLVGVTTAWVNEQKIVNFILE